MKKREGKRDGCAKRTWEKSLALHGDAELDADVVGDDVELGPAAFADREIGAAQREPAFEDAVVALGGEAGREAQVLALALDRQLAGDLVAVVAERLDAARHKAGDREGGAVEPRLAGDFLVGFGRAGVDAGQLDIEADAGSGWLGRVKTQLAGKFAEAAVHLDA